MLQLVGTFRMLFLMKKKIVFMREVVLKGKYGGVVGDNYITLPFYRQKNVVPARIHQIATH